MIRLNYLLSCAGCSRSPHHPDCRLPVQAAAAPHITQTVVSLYRLQPLPTSPRLSSPCAGWSRSPHHPDCRLPVQAAAAPHITQTVVSLCRLQPLPTSPRLLSPCTGWSRSPHHPGCRLPVQAGAAPHITQTVVSLCRLEPLLARIGESRSAVVGPTVNSISPHNLDYRVGARNTAGGFSWGLHFMWRGMPKEETLRRVKDSDPIRSATP